MIFRAKEGSDLLINKLNEAKIEYLDFQLYELKENTEKKSIISALNIKSFDVDYLVFGSAKGVTTFFDNFKADFDNKIKIVCIGQKCAQALGNYNVSEIMIADTYNIDGIIECLEKNQNKDSKWKDLED